MGKKMGKKIVVRPVAIADVVAPAPAPVAPAAPVRNSYGLTIFGLKEIPDGTKIATQARLVARVIFEAGKNGLTETALAAKLVPAGLVTRQNPLRIYRFYRKMLVAGGFIATR